ncbi:MAG: hypothetical protein DRH04_09385, partial [Deltaproteobacteria bacterium]
MIELVLSLLIAATSIIEQHQPVRPNLPDQGYGWLINDLEQHTHAGHPMRNEQDPGNWAHELTHQVNSDLRQLTRANDGAFYWDHGEYCRLLYPNVTLAQVAGMVPRDKRGEFYHLYLIEMQRWWNNECLYVLDEATAYANGLQYHATTHTKDAHRLQGAKEFIDYSNALVAAVEKYDPDYK